MKADFYSKYFHAYHNIRQVWNRYKYLFFLILGFISGVVTVVILIKTTGKDITVDTLSDFNMDLFDDNYKKIVMTGRFEHMKLWQNVLMVRFRDFLFLLILGFTRYYEIWVCIYVMFEGVLAGILMSVTSYMIGRFGPLLLMALLLPHYIIYIAVVVLMIKFFNKKNYNFKNTTAIVSLFILMIFVGTILESFVNPYIQRWILYQISDFIK